jgi:2-polyprenyl-3-methyl-5-hydroxy-6-metoxy-1,4-benzoquinol methylase
MQDLLTKLKRWCKRVILHRPSRLSREDWEAQYSIGQPGYYREISELARYHVVVGYCHFLKPSGTILDLGCGEGILQERLDPCKHSRYVGVDFSNEAIRLASSRQDEKTLFVTADVSTYVPNEQFDVVIFGECLYCFKDPLSVIRRYDPFLKNDGLFIVSMTVHESVNALWEIIDKVYEPHDEVKVTHRSGLSWIVKIYHKAGIFLIWWSIGILDLGY